jgi:hypothetical protein
MSDIELMEKYNLSARGINRLFNRLVERGDIEQSELDARAMALRWGEVAFVRSEGRNPEPIDDRDDEVPSGRARFEEFVENHKVILAAVLGAIAGIVFTVTSMTVVIGPKRALELIGLRPEKAEAAATLQDPLNVLAEQIIAILESLARGDPGSLSSSDRVRSSRYEECLRDCDNQYSGSDDFDQAVRVDCRKKCVVLYSERMRKIRELYHGSGLRP